MRVSEGLFQPLFKPSPGLGCLEAAATPNAAVHTPQLLLLLWKRNTKEPFQVYIQLRNCLLAGCLRSPEDHFPLNPINQKRKNKAGKTLQRSHKLSAAAAALHVLLTVQQQQKAPKPILKKTRKRLFWPTGCMYRVVRLCLHLLVL